MRGHYQRHNQCAGDVTRYRVGQYRANDCGRSNRYESVRIYAEGATIHVRDAESSIDPIGYLGGDEQEP